MVRIAGMTPRVTQASSGFRLMLSPFPALPPVPQRRPPRDARTLSSRVPAFLHPSWGPSVAATAWPANNPWNERYSMTNKRKPQAQPKRRVPNFEKMTDREAMTYVFGKRRDEGH